MVMTAPDKPRRRWLRFSLRSLFLLIVVIAVSLGWTLYKVRQQGIAVAELKKMGCLVTYDNADWGSPTVLERLRKLLGEDESRSVVRVRVEMEKTFTDAGLVHLRALTQLQYLALDGTQVTDGGLVHLRGMTRLQYLILDRTQVTDAGLVHLRALTQLEVLYLDGTQVTAAGLVHLQGLTQLQLLTVGGTQVTNAGIQRLQKALPNCKIKLQP